MPAQYTQGSYQGIIDAFNQVRENQGEVKRGYDANYRGIIEAILDLRKWGQAGDGSQPPGWVPEYDQDGNIIGGDYLPVPDNGTIWFDERQGRLFVWIDDGWYQTNGGDGLPHLGENPPATEVPGAFWYSETAQILYIYNGSEWTAVSAPAGVSTAALLLSDATRSARSTNRPHLPDTSALGTQSDLNKWIFDALEQLENEIESTSGKFQVYMSDTPPDSATEGDLWYNTTSLQMLIRYDEAWVASAIPLVLDDSFLDLSNTVEINRDVAAAGVADALNQIEQLANRPERVFTLGYDANEDGIQLLDSKGSSQLIKLRGAGGINVDVTNQGVQIDASSITNSLNTLEQTVASGANLNALDGRLSIVEGNVGTLLNTPVVNPTSFADLSATVAGLPTASDVSGRLSLLGGTLEGQVSMNNHRILNVGVPTQNTDAARKLDVDNLKSYADSTYLTKDAPSVSGFSIQKSDTQSPVFDFTNGAYNSIEALKMRTLGGTDNITTFGTTETPWEYAWKFGSEEDFCWVHDTTGKQVSITKDGLAAKSLTLGTFLPNDDCGTVVMNKIDVGESLAKHKEALQTIKAALIVSTSYEEFKLEVLQTLNTI